MVLAHILIVIPIFLLMKNMDDTPSINLILGMLGYLLIMPTDLRWQSWNRLFTPLRICPALK